MCGRSCPHARLALRPMTLSSIQRRTIHALKYFRALAVLTSGCPAHIQAEIEKEIQQVPSRTNKQLQELLNHFESMCREIERAVGCRLSAEQYILFVDGLLQKDDDLTFIIKHGIDTGLFASISNIAPTWNRYPPHCRIGVDAKGQFPATQAGRQEWRLLEAMLFEDLAMLWNECLANRTDDRGLEFDQRIPGKKFRALKRSAVRAVFALLEGYLNGIAADILLTRASDSLSKKDFEMLRERGDDGRAKHQSLRNKLLQYPKLSIGAEHPPITGDEQDVALVLSREREWRDAAMHPSPQKRDGEDVSREQTVFEIDLDDIGKLLKASLSVIERVDTILGLFRDQRG